MFVCDGQQSLLDMLEHDLGNRFLVHLRRGLGSISRLLARVLAKLDGTQEACLVARC